MVTLACPVSQSWSSVNIFQGYVCDMDRTIGFGRRGNLEAGRKFLGSLALGINAAIEKTPRFPYGHPILERTLQRQKG